MTSLPLSVEPLSPSAEILLCHLSISSLSSVTQLPCIVQLAPAVWGVLLSASGLRIATQCSQVSSVVSPVNTCRHTKGSKGVDMGRSVGWR